MTVAWGSVRAAGVMAGTTIGAGMFALPYVFDRAGWLLGAAYVFAAVISVTAIHYLYFRALETVGERNRLLGLVRNTFGNTGFYPAFFVVVVGLLLALVVYLILGTEFLRVVMPQLDGGYALFLFWAASSLPLLLGLRGLAKIEIFGALIMGAIILAIFFFSLTAAAPAREFFQPREIFLPFGPVLFALAGWTAVEPIYELISSGPRTRRGALIALLGAGTLAAAVLYFLFIEGALRLSLPSVSPDGISALLRLPDWGKQGAGLLGLFAIWTSFVPIGLEVANELEKDMKLPKVVGLSVVVAVPLALVLLGLDNFIRAIGLAGGIFLGLQYVCIIAIGARIVPMNRISRLFFGALGIMFLLAAAYEIHYFVIARTPS
ncbi:hypothetical protein C4587_01395 [Candidatus Parcubacteria bacterium]|nr:MAG: hypothetical protein C4587_01395 [Candidatus Parcubacteria bacterium]